MRFATSTFISCVVVFLSASAQQSTNCASAFTFSGGSTRVVAIARHQLQSDSTSKSTSRLFSSQLAEPSIGFETSCVLTKEEVAPIIVLKEGTPKEKWINIQGLVNVVATVITCPIWALAMYATDAVCNQFPDLDPNRSFYDRTGKIWAKTFLTITNSFPTISGDVERLRLKDDEQNACLFVANHASWLDIPVLCTILDPVFKFIAKGELKGVPCIGQQLVGGNHIMIDREDRRSQLRTFKEGVRWLNNGVPLMAFPEGKRSQDGRLMDFKGGIFSMAVKSKVPIVPISISNTHAVMPTNGLFPVQAGAGKLHVHVHPPIDVEGKSDKELSELVRAALLSKIPLDQHPLPEVAEEEVAVPASAAAAVDLDHKTVGAKDHKIVGAKDHKAITNQAAELVPKIIEASNSDQTESKDLQKSS